MIKEVKIVRERNMKMVIYGNPATKKNSMQIYKNSRTGRPFLTQSERYKDYARDCAMQITGKYKQAIDYPINLKCVYYRQTKHRVDLTNLLAATCDILTDCGVIADDNYKVVRSHDGSRVLFDKDNPRVEIEIKECV
jgi:endodeoxyribonuclease rusA|nr:MAG TPA: Endodeoxyribonuclease RusA [Caudoviricetes sp.]